jgi:hypothetical protein
VRVHISFEKTRNSATFVQECAQETLRFYTQIPWFIHPFTVKRLHVRDVRDLLITQTGLFLIDVWHQLDASTQVFSSPTNPQPRPREGGKLHSVSPLLYSISLITGNALGHGILHVGHGHTATLEQIAPSARLRAICRIGSCYAESHHRHCSSSPVLDVSTAPKLTRRDAS